MSKNIWLNEKYFQIPKKNGSKSNATTKGQIISECPYEIIVSSKIPTKKCPRFLP